MLNESEVEKINYKMGLVLSLMDTPKLTWNSKRMYLTLKQDRVALQKQLYFYGAADSTKCCATGTCNGPVTQGN